MKKVWSIRIKGKMDCVVLNDEEAMIVKMKFMPDIQMYDMTTLHNIKPEHLHKVNRGEALEKDIHLLWIKNSLETGVLGGKPGEYVKESWYFNNWDL